MRSPKLRSKRRGSTRPASSVALNWSNLMGMTLIGTRSLPAVLEELRWSGARLRRGSVLRPSTDKVEAILAASAAAVYANVKAGPVVRGNHLQRWSLAIGAGWAGPQPKPSRSQHQRAKRYGNFFIGNPQKRYAEKLTRRSADSPLLNSHSSGFCWATSAYGQSATSLSPS